jgi:RraA family protein
MPGQIGFRIRTDVPRTPAALVEAFRGKASSDVADAMGRLNVMDPGIVGRTDRPLCGPAVTVKVRPGDNLMVHKALQVAAPGDVIVVSTQGNTTTAVFGGLMATTAVAAGLGGVVVDGAVRDLDGLRELAFPVFSRSVSPGGPDRAGPGEINVPIACGGAAVLPGDLVVGDADGVVVVPRDDAAAVLENLLALEALEEKRRAAIRSGAIHHPAVDETLRAKGLIPG